MPCASPDVKPAILVVDDERDIAGMITEILEVSDYKTYVAYDGETALQKIQNNHLDLILLDMMLPGINGWEVARRIRSDPQTANIPIIALTAGTSRQEALAAGCSDYMEKPFDMTNLLDMVELHSRMAASQSMLTACG